MNEPGRVRFAGLAIGGASFIGAWLVGAAIARLTGAAAVLLLLTATAVGFAAAVVSARRSVRRIGVLELTVAPLTTVGAPTSAVLHLTGDERGRAGFDRAGLDRDGVVGLFDGRRRLATVSFADLDPHGIAHLTVCFERAGIIDRLDVEVAHAGLVGLVWMRHRRQVPIEPIRIAPQPTGPAVDIDAAPSDLDGPVVTEHGPRHGEIDGVRTWRDGEGLTSVHWPTTLRSGGLIVHDRQTALDRRWVIDVPVGPMDPDDAARLTYTLLEGVRAGHRVALRRPAEGGTDGQALIAVSNADDARRWGAELIGHRAPDAPAPAHWAHWARRAIRIGAVVDTFTSVGARSRWLTTASSLIALGMLIGALASDPSTIALGAGGLVVGTIVSLWCAQRGSRPLWLRLLVGTATLSALGYIASTVGGVGGLLEALRGPLPDLLMLLLVIHGFEVVDRRTLRVHQAIGAVMIAYATGLRIDDRVAWWLAAWAVTMIAAVRSTTLDASRPPVRRPAGIGAIARPFGAVTAGVIATLTVLSIVPVPDGPARLGLPALSNNAPSVPTAGGLAGPSGTPPAVSDGTRGSLGEVGGYPGFTETMDTSIRGDLGNQVVMRVRAPEPDFWRGQTFTTFDGRLWTVSPEIGRRRSGPQIDVPATLGDLPRPGLDTDTEELVQTYYVEADLPNVVFAAARPDVVTFDGSIYTRPDGALRSDVTLNEGSVYTVVSQRVQVTSESLRAQGDVAPYFAGFTNPRQREVLDPYLEIPESTTQRTIDLADQLRRPGASTYDTVLAYQAWLSLNTEYDLNAPVPAPGADAVDDFLFVSRRGFCEQIASSLAIMLRSQGVPARIATGYIPGVRDKVSGVFEVRARDAHAWVEVWFPDSGWQAFDPTASVPLSGEVDQGSVGGDLVSAAISGITARPVEFGLLVALGTLMAGAYRAAVEFLRRRRRGRWGVLQDRFTALADPTAITNPARADGFDDPAARELAALLDRAAFDPTWPDARNADDADTDDGYARARSALETLTTGRTRSS